MVDSRKRLAVVKRIIREETQSTNGRAIALAAHWSEETIPTNGSKSQKTPLNRLFQPRIRGQKNCFTGFRK
jgi:hypothetical protein